MEQAGKNTILLVRGTAAEPVGLSAFAAAQPDVQVQTVSGLDEARTALGRQHPTLIVMQSDAPGGQDLRRCAEVAAGAEAVFLLLLKKSMQAQTDQLRAQLQDLKRIQKAKGLLMRQLGMTEQDAHRWIEKAAMDRCVKKREIAETIIRMYEL